MVPKGRENALVNWTIYKGILLLMNAISLNASVMIFNCAILNAIFGTKLPPSMEPLRGVYSLALLVLLPVAIYELIRSASAVHFFFSHSIKALKVHFWLTAIVTTSFGILFIYMLFVYSPGALSLGIIFGPQCLYLFMLAQLMELCPRFSNQDPSPTDASFNFS